LNQPFSLVAAASADEALLASVTPKLRLWRPTFSASALAQMTVGSSVTPLALGGQAPEMIAWPGMQLTVSVRPFRAARRELQSPVVAELRLAGSVGIVATLPLVTTAPSSTTSTIAATTTTAPAVTAADRQVDYHVTGRPIGTRAGG
jgi:hypothetical protein